MYDPQIVKKYVTTKTLAQEAGAIINENNQSVAFWRNGDNNTAILYNDDDGTCHDFVTNKHYDVFSLYMEMKGYDFSTALKVLGDKYCPHENTKNKPKKLIKNTITAKQNKPSLSSQSTLSNEEIAKRLSDDLEQGIKQGKYNVLPSMDYNGYIETAVYEYRYENGNLAYTKHRKERINENGKREKTFSFCLADGKTWKEPPENQRLLYNLPNIIKPENQTIYINEGEKSADACIKRGLCATTSGSSSSWKKQFADDLKGKDVVILRDNDDVGLKYALTIASDLLGVAKSVKYLITCNDEKGDVADFFDNEIKDENGNVINEQSKLDKLMEMVNAAPIITENDRARLKDELEEVKKGISKENGSLGGRPKKDEHEPDVIADKLLTEYTTPQGIRLIYCYGKRWFIYGLQGNAWKEEEEDTINKKVTSYLQNQNHLIDKGNKAKIEDERKKAQKSNGKDFDEKKVKGLDQRYFITAGNVHNIVINLAAFGKCGLCSLKYPVWLDAPQTSVRPNGIGWLNVKNGIINVYEAGRALAENKPIPDGTIKPHSPAFFSLNQQLPVNFNPNAKCPNFEKILSQLLPDSESRKHLQMMFSYFLIPNDFKFNVAFILYGQGGTGKSTIVKTLRLLLSDSNISTVKYLRFGERFQIAGMLNTILNIDEDMAKDEGKNLFHDVGATEEELKKITDGNLITIETKGKQPFDATISAHLLFCTNNLPHINDRSGAYLDRIRIIPFTQRFRKTKEEINKYEMEKLLTNELEGIFNWALKGAGMLQGLTCFPELAASREIKATIEEQQWPIMIYVKDNFAYDLNGFVSTAEAYEDYVKWASDNNQRPESLTHLCEAIKAQFPNVEYKQKNIGGKRQRGYLGISYNRQNNPQLKTQRLADDSDMSGIDI